VLAFVRSGGKVHVIAGAVSGGAALVVKEASGPRDLIGQRLAAPQIGNSQDVSLRFWLKQQGINASDKPGREVAVLPLSSSDILALFKRGELAAAWVPEPWVSRLVAEAGGKILLDERSLWPDGEFPTTVLVVTDQALTQRRREVEAVVRAHEELTLRYAEDPAAFQAQVNEAFAEITQKKLPPEVIQQAFSRLELTTHPMQPQLEETARRLVGLGYLPHADVSGLVDGSLLSRPSE
jgi:NitT/TauT family transport system substrate-binding protein